MTPDPEFTWMIDWTLVTVMGNAMPPRDPNDNDDEDEEDEEDDSIKTTSRRSSENPTKTNSAARAQVLPRKQVGAGRKRVAPGVLIHQGA